MRCLGPVCLSSEDSSEWSSAAHSVQGVFVVASQTEWNVIEVSLDSEGRPFSSGGGRRLTPPLLTPGGDASRVSAWQPVGATSSPLSQGIFHPLVEDSQGTVDRGELPRSLKWTHHWDGWGE